MKSMIVIALLLVSTASAAWNDLKEGLDPAAAVQCVGAPLFSNRSRGGTYVNWVYDNGGSIFFENGRVRFWQEPAVKSGGVQFAPGGPAVATVADHGKAGAVSALPANRAGASGMTLAW